MIPWGPTIPWELGCPRTSQPLRVIRAWPRDPGHALLHLARPDGGTLAGQWFGSAERLAHTARRTPEPAYAVSEAGVLVQPDGADRRLRTLAELAREHRARIVAHRAERRAVVALPDRYVKLVRPGRSHTLVQANETARDAVGDHLRLASVLHHEPDAATVSWSVLPGQTLHELGRHAGLSEAALAAAWWRLGAGLGRLHAVPGGDRPAHPPTEEAEVTLRWWRLAHSYGLLADDEGELARVARQLAALPEVAARLVHRDLHDKQVLLDEDTGAVALLDLDTLAAGDPAVDIANVLVHLELRVAQGTLSRQRAASARAAFLSGLDYDGTVDLMADRVHAYAAAARLRLRAVYAFRRGGTSLPGRPRAV